MNNVLNIVENSQKSEFYPTPEVIAEKMLQGINWHMIGTILKRKNVSEKSILKIGNITQL